MAYMVFLLLIISLTSATVDVQFLAGVPRLNNSAFWDYYFSCNALGRTLLWEVNGDGLNGFHSVDAVADVLSGSRSDFNFTATLLFARNSTEGQYSFDSVLVVSVTRRLTLNVICRNGSTKSSTSNSEEKSSTINNMASNNVYLQYILSERIVNMTLTNNLTSILICGVDNSFMRWETSANDYLFSTSYAVGTSIQHLKASDNLVTQQAILICREPYTLVTVFLVTSDEDINVTCGYPNNELQLISAISVTAGTTSGLSESDTTGEELVNATLFRTSSGSTGMTPTSPSTQHSTIILPVVILVLMLMMLLVTLTVCYLVLCKHWCNVTISRRLHLCFWTIRCACCGCIRYPDVKKIDCPNNAVHPKTTDEISTSRIEVDSITVDISNEDSDYRTNGNLYKPTNKLNSESAKGQNKSGLYQDLSAETFSTQ